MIGYKGCFIQCLSVVMIYSEGNLFLEGFLFQFYSIFNASSQLTTFSYLHNWKSPMLLFHKLGYTESILYICYFISLLSFIHSLPVFLPFLNASFAEKWKKTNIYKSEYTAANITQWFCRAMKPCIISVKI